ncbi:hypothetical protein H5410_056269 [Solanum commersonii]|uniref:Putative plant transposon protein domain-containing protein n=1 Tax=Solanum commersonii TaxID=4109 RepID=A0A9J5WLN8_SOLCO|nr:hypothetical protein H5410_056269 [Solanum commersonii]
MEFLFVEPSECNLHLVREFYANWASDACSHVVTVRGVDVPLTLAVIKDIVGTSHDTNPLVLTGLKIRPPYLAIQHTLCGPQSMVQYIKHSGMRFHQSLPYAYMLKETQVWLKIVINCLLPGLHHIDITRDIVCLVYALMTPIKLNIGDVLKLTMKKASVHKVRMFPRRACGLHGATIPSIGGHHEDKRVDTKFSPTLTTAEHYRRDELIMAMMYGLEMLLHQNGCLTSTNLQLGDVERRNPLNSHAKALLGIGSAFRELVDDDILTDEERLHTSSNVESDSDNKVDPLRPMIRPKGVKLWKIDQGVTGDSANA